MKKGSVFSSVTLALFLLSSVVGADIDSLMLKKDLGGGLDKPGNARAFAGGRSVGAETYRSPGALRKVVISADDAEGLAFALAAGAVEVADYGSFKLYAMGQPALDRLAVTGARGPGGESLAPSHLSVNKPAAGVPSL